MPPVDRIKRMIPYLPKKDFPIAEKLISTRNFENLKELVESAIYKVRRSQNSDTPKEEYKDINLNILERLKAEIDAYLLLLGVPEDEVFYENDYGDTSDDINELSIDNFDYV